PGAGSKLRSLTSLPDRPDPDPDPTGRTMSETGTLLSTGCHSTSGSRVPVEPLNEPVPDPVPPSVALLVAEPGRPSVRTGGRGLASTLTLEVSPVRSVQLEFGVESDPLSSMRTTLMLRMPALGVVTVSS